MEKNNKKKKILKVSGLIALFLIVFGLSYALFQVTLNGTKKVKLKTGKLELQLLDENNSPIYVTGQNSESSFAINLENQVPESDEVGLDQEGFTFKLKNTGNVKAKYTIYLDDVVLGTDETRIDDGYVKYALTKNGTESTPALVSSMVVDNARELDKGVIETDNTTNTYTLKIWIDEAATNAAMDKVFSATLRVEAVQYVQTGPFEDGTFAAALYNKGVVGEYNATISKIPDACSVEHEESGLYKYTDEAGTTTYAYRGLPEDNYVSFADQTWRILRIQEDGTVKLIRDEAVNYENSDYDAGSSDTVNGVTYRRVQYNKTSSSDDDSKYSTSNIKSYVEAWYNDTMTSYDSKIATNEYCSDRTENHNSFVYQNWYSDWSTLYGLYNSMDSDGMISPSMTCTAEKISSKVALITVDEFALSSGSEDNYLIKNYYYFTMSSAGLNVSDSMVYYIRSNCEYDYCPSSDNATVIPIITLKVNVLPSSGDGTSEHPYVIS